MSLSKITQKRFDEALKQCVGLHATCVRDTYLSIFSRVARENPVSLKPVIGMLASVAAVGGNTVASLYCLIKLADISDEAKALIKSNLPEDFILYWSEDSDSKISGNAKILAKVLGGDSLANLSPSNSTSSQTININAGRDVNIARQNIKTKN